MLHDMQQLIKGSIGRTSSALARSSAPESPATPIGAATVDLDKLTGNRSKEVSLISSKAAP